MFSLKWNGDSLFIILLKLYTLYTQVSDVTTNQKMKPFTVVLS